MRLNCTITEKGRFPETGRWFCVFLCPASACPFDSAARGFLCHRKVRPMTSKRSARIAMRRKRILSQKRPAAGGEARERASFLCQELK